MWLLYLFTAPRSLWNPPGSCHLFCVEYFSSFKKRQFTEAVIPTHPKQGIPHVLFALTTMELFEWLSLQKRGSPTFQNLLKPNAENIDQEVLCVLNQAHHSYEGHKTLLLVLSSHARMRNWKQANQLHSCMKIALVFPLQFESHKNGYQSPKICNISTFV